MERDWTVSEGIRNALRFLGRRSVWAFPLWFAVAFVFAFFTRLGASGGEVSWFGILVAFLALHAGVAVGVVYTRGLCKAAGFVGPVVTGLACGASAATVVLATLAAGLCVPYPSALVCGFVWSSGSIGAAAAAVKVTWADE